MYIWEVELEENWSYAKREWNNNIGTMNISARSFEEALKKASDKLMKSPSFADDDGVVQNIVAVRPVRVERKEKLDA
jgi:hypothetical protein